MELEIITIHIEHFEFYESHGFHLRDHLEDKLEVGNITKLLQRTNSTGSKSKVSAISLNLN